MFLEPLPGRYQTEKSMKRPTEVVGNALHKRTESHGMIIENFLSIFLYIWPDATKCENDLDCNIKMVKNVRIVLFLLAPRLAKICCLE